MDEVLTKMEKEADMGSGDITLYKLFIYLSYVLEYAKKPIVLMIDEVDIATNNQVFLDFLAKLRVDYLNRQNRLTFQSVILVGVYNIKHLRTKIRPDDQHKNNSTWNIAADFDIDMSLSAAGIEGMLADYETDYNTGMDIREMAALIYDYTSGYPFLVSRLCKYIDEKIAGTRIFLIKELHGRTQDFNLPTE